VKGLSDGDLEHIIMRFSGLAGKDDLTQVPREN